MKSISRVSLIAAGSLLLAPGLALASSFCDAVATPWAVRAGGHNIDPTAGTSHTAAGDVRVDSKFAVTLNLDYRLCRTLEVDLLLALPVTQDIQLNGSEFGSTQHLPPTLTLQYHPLPDARFDPFAGIGVNYTRFFNESLDSAALGLHLKNTVGFAVRAGLDYHISPRWLAGIDVRYMQIEPDAYVNGAAIGKVKINPIAYGAQLGYRF